MIGVERLERCLEILAATPNVKGGIGPVSANLIAPNGGGKTELMLKTMPAGARVLNDITTMTLNAMMSEEKPPSYLVVPDFNIVINHKPAVAELTIALLLALMGEGVSELHPGLENEVRVMMTRRQKTGLRIALLTGMTPEMFMGKRGKWRGTGFLRRFIPLYYTYTRRTQEDIQTSIQQGKDILSYHHVRRPKVKTRAVNIGDRHAELLRQLSEQVVDQLGWRTGDSRDGKTYTVKATAYPFSVHKMLRQLARAAAILNDHGTVTAADISDTEMVARFMRYDRPEEI